MKAHVLRLVLSAGLAALAPVQPSLASDDRPLPATRAHKIECEFAADFVKRMVGPQAGPKILSDRPFGPLRTITRADKMTDAWKARGPTNVFTACPELRASLPANARFATEGDWAAVSKLPSNETMITMIGAPFLTPDGKAIIIEHLWTCAGLCGGGFVLRYRRVGVSWSAESEPLSMWIS